MRYRDSLSLVLILVLSLNFSPVTHAEEAIFSDVSSGSPYFTTLKYLKEQGLINGYEDGSFQPDKEINRAEALAILSKAIKREGAKIQEEPLSFADVKKEDWFYKDVEDAWGNGLVHGYPDQLFHPEKALKVAEGLKMVLLQEGDTLPTEVLTPPYSDVPIDAWAAPYAQVAKERTLFLESRSDGSLQSDASLTRGTFAQLIYRLIKSAKGSRFARATWYADFMAKTRTASGEPYEPRQFTTAHKTLPFGTLLHVTSLSNGKSVDVVVNDRGPYPRGIDLDLSRSAFEALAPAGTGIITVEFEVIKSPESKDTNTDELPPKIVEYGF